MGFRLFPFARFASGTEKVPFSSEDSLSIAPSSQAWRRSACLLPMDPLLVRSCPQAHCRSYLAAICADCRVSSPWGYLAFSDSCPLLPLYAVTCPCKCSSDLASKWYYGLSMCKKGVATSQEWLETFTVKTTEKLVKGKGTKKKAEASSKASTPTKDGENADNASSGDEAKVRACISC